MQLLYHNKILTINIKNIRILLGINCPNKPSDNIVQCRSRYFAVISAATLGQTL